MLQCPIVRKKKIKNLVRAADLQSKICSDMIPMKSAPLTSLPPSPCMKKDDFTTGF